MYAWIAKKFLFLRKWAHRDLDKNSFEFHDEDFSLVIGHIAGSIRGILEKNLKKTDSVSYILTT